MRCSASPPPAPLAYPSMKPQSLHSARLYAASCTRKFINRKKKILCFAKGSQAERMEQFAQQCERALSEQVKATLFATYQVASRSGVNSSTRSARATSRTRSRPAKTRDVLRRLHASLAAYQVAAEASAGTRAASRPNIVDLRYLGKPRQVHLPQAIGQAPTASSFSATRTRSC